MKPEELMTPEERKDFCAADNGEPYPPCVNPYHTCADCKRTHEWAKRLLELNERGKQPMTSNGFTVTTT